MADILLGFIVGLLVGWNLLSQPEWVKNGWGWAWGKVKSQVKKEDTTSSSNT